MLVVDESASSPPSPSDQPRCDRPTRPISDFSPAYPDHALWFTAIRAFPGQGAAHGIVRPASPEPLPQRRERRAPATVRLAGPPGPGLRGNRQGGRRYAGPRLKRSPGAPSGASP